MSRKYVIKDVPKNELDAQINILKQDGASEVTYEPQDNGKYTIIAVYPE